ncbi:MAG: SPFH domain-containing protein [Candidatus Lokiarchaeia archaeon]
MPELIEWTGAGAQDIVWRYPDNRLTWGATLIVAENQVAVFFRDGKAYDVFGPGRHVLSTQNLPLLSKVYSRLRGFKKSEFTSDVIYVSTSQFQGKFGGRGQTQELAPLMFHGSFWFKVEEPKLFVVEVVGNSKAYTTDAVNEFIRGFVVERLIDTLAGFTMREVFTQLDESGMKAKTQIKEQFGRIGVDLMDLKFEGMDTTEEYRERLFWLQTAQVRGERLATLETTKSAAESLGKGGGAAAAGTGMVILPQMLQQPTGPQMAVATCPKCGSQIPANARFCNNCGVQLGSGKTCAKCKTTVPPGSRFCPSCGAKV